LYFTESSINVNRLALASPELKWAFSGRVYVSDAVRDPRFEVDVDWDSKGIGGSAFEDVQSILGYVKIAKTRLFGLKHKYYQNESSN
jgi:hypothetical protein